MAQIPWGRVRGVAAAILVVVGLVLAPVSVVVAHARSLLTDTDRFVATFGPLASDRGVQDAVGDAAIAAVDATVDFSALADSALQGLADRLSLPPLVTGALQSVGDGVAGALRSVVDDQIRSIVTSDAFPPLWEQMLRAAHARAVAGIQGDPSAALVVRGDTLLLQVGPVVDRARQILVDRGSRFASLIPQVDRTVELVEVPGLSAVAAGHGAVVVLGAWLPGVLVDPVVARDADDPLRGSLDGDQRHPVAVVDVDQAFEVPRRQPIERVEEPEVGGALGLRHVERLERGPVARADGPDPGGRAVVQHDVRLPRRGVLGDGGGAAPGGLDHADRLDQPRSRSVRER